MAPDAQKDLSSAHRPATGWLFMAGRRKTGERTVQGVLEEAFRRIAGAPVASKVGGPTLACMRWGNGA